MRILGIGGIYLNIILHYIEDLKWLTNRHITLFYSKKRKNEAQACEMVCDVYSVKKKYFKKYSLHFFKEHGSDNET